MRILVIAALSLLAFTASAADRIEKIRTLMDAQGLLQLWDQQLATSKQQARAQAQQSMDQVLATLNVSPKVDAQFRDAMDEYVKNLETPWTAQNYVDVWAQKYGYRFSDEELDGMVAYYTSALGRKDVAATQAAMPEFIDHFAELSKPITEKANKAFLKRLEKVAQDCNCRKKSDPTGF